MTSDLRGTHAVLFDVDGTLIDSNYLHVQAWSEALEAAGRPVDDARIHRAIGMDSAKLLAELLGEEAESDVGEKAKAKHAKRYKKVAPRLRPFAGARDILKALSERGMTVVLATSAPPDELANLRKALDAEDFISLATSADDVETAKPEPDLIKVALDKAGATPQTAMMIGDAVWDGVAAKRARVPFIGVRSGGRSAAELTEAGAIAVYDDVAQLLRELDSSPLRPLLS
jgi:HAD superfamily hydrolase (TIGR01509 family)